jgi:hypothetical protein
MAERLMVMLGGHYRQSRRGRSCPCFDGLWAMEKTGASVAEIWQRAEGLGVPTPQPSKPQVMAVLATVFPPREVSRVACTRWRMVLP